MSRNLPAVLCTVGPSFIADILFGFVGNMWRLFRANGCPTDEEITDVFEHMMQHTVYTLVLYISAELSSSRTRPSSSHFVLQAKYSVSDLPPTRMQRWWSTQKTTMLNRKVTSLQVKLGGVVSLRMPSWSCCLHPAKRKVWCLAERLYNCWSGLAPNLPLLSSPPVRSADSPKQLVALRLSLSSVFTSHRI